MTEPEKVLQAIDRAQQAYARQRTPDAVTVITLIDAARVVVDANPTQHLCDDIAEDDEGFVYGICSCGWRTFSVPSTDLAVDELMAHSVREAITVRKCDHCGESIELQDQHACPRNSDYAEASEQEKQ